jgi:hypothetical protein
MIIYIPCKAMLLIICRNNYPCSKNKCLYNKISIKKWKLIWETFWEQHWHVKRHYIFGFSNLDSQVEMKVLYLRFVAGAVKSPYHKPRHTLLFLCIPIFTFNLKILNITLLLRQTGWAGESWMVWLAIVKL